MILLWAIAIGFVAGLRSMTAPAAVCWAAHLKWIDLHDSRLAVLGSSAATYILTVFAIVELIADKLPFVPSRIKIGPLVARMIAGGLSGAAICISAHASVLLGILAGAVGAIAGAFAGYHVRRRLVPALKVPDFVIAIFEDVLAVGGAFLILSRV